MKEKQSSPPKTPPKETDMESSKEKTILIGENEDILARYRIPIENNRVDYALQLPEDSDSSIFSQENVNMEDANDKNDDGTDAKGDGDGEEDGKNGEGA